MQDYDGLDVIDATGAKIGTVGQTYDDESGTSRFIEVTMGSLFSKERRLVPVDDAQVTDDGIQVPYGKSIVDGSPDASSAGEELEGDLLNQVRSYYSGNLGDAASNGEQAGAAIPVGKAVNQTTTSVSSDSTDSSQIGTVRDLGDVIEVPIIEEEIVKRPVVKEVLRIKKTQVAETQTFGADVRKEDVEVIEDGEHAVE